MYKPTYTALTMYTKFNQCAWIYKNYSAFHCKKVGNNYN